MKKHIFIISIILFCIPLFSYSQKDEPFTNLEHMDKRKFQWGYYFGINQMNFKFNYNELDNTTTDLKDIQVNKSIGFNVGVTFNLRLIDYLDLRFEPGLTYNLRELIYPQLEDKRDKIRTIRSTYIYFPLLLKVSTKRWYNFKPYITGGVSTAIDLSSGEKLNTDNLDGIFRMKQNVFFYELGIGIDLYTPYFRFSPSIRGIFSFRNEMVGDIDPNSPWTGNINGMFTRGFLINLIFE